MAMAEDATGPNKKRRKNKYRDQPVRVLISFLGPDTTLRVFKNYMPKKPKAGEMLIFEFDDPQYQLNWRNDDYLWKADGNGSPKFNDIECQKTYHKLRIKIGDSDDCYTWDFCKRVLFCPLYPHRYLVWYLGDEKAAVNLPHGNAKSEEGIATKTFTPSNESTKLSIKREVKSTEKPPLLIHEKMMRAENSEDFPRNLMQVQNFHKSIKREEELHFDSWFALHEFANDYNFVSDIKTVPSLIAVCCSPSIIDMFKFLIGHPELPPVCLSYDTTFDLGDFYVSTLTFRSTEFSEKPILPLMSMIHQRKNKEAHNMFFGKLVELLPELNEVGQRRAYLVTDEEDAFLVAIRTFLPNLRRHRCWIHTWRNMKAKLQSLGIREHSSLAQFRDDFIGMLNLPTLQAYTDKVIHLIEKWNLPVFSSYYTKNIHEDAKTMGIWALKDYDITLLSNNQAESFNATIKRFVQWKRQRVDMAALSMLRLTEYFERRVLWSRQGKGDYRLVEAMATYYAEQPHCSLPQVYDIEKLYESLRNPQTPQDIQETSEDELRRDLPPVFSKEPSLLERAMCIVNQKKIEHLPHLKIWTVVGGSGRIHNVRLFKNNKIDVDCTCPAGGLCAHALAAMLSIDFVFTTGRLKNVQAMMKRALKNPNKRMGTKKPTPADKEKKLSKTTKSQDDAVSWFVQEMLDEEEETCRLETHRSDSDAVNPVKVRIEQSISSSICPKSNAMNQPMLKQSDPEESVSRLALENEVDRYLDNLPLHRTPAHSTEDYSNIDYHEKQSRHYNTDGKVANANDSIAPTITAEELQPQIALASPAGNLIQYSSIESFQEDIREEHSEEPLRELVSSPNSIQSSSFPEDIRVEHSKEPLQELVSSPNLKGPQRRPIKRCRSTNKENVSPPRAPELPTSSSPSQDPLLRDLAFSPSAPRIKDREWLSSDHINGWNVLLRQLARTRNISICGIYNVDGAPDLLYQPADNKKFVQILHNGSRKSGHWSVVAGGFDFIPKDTVALYDSLEREDDWEGPNFYMQRLIASIIRSPRKNIRISLMPSSKQNANGIPNYFDCGPYSFAFATALLLGENPSNLEFSRNNVREHVRSCFASQEAKPFDAIVPKRRPMKVREFSFDIFCFCRLPSNGKEEMVSCDKCDEWFHRSCLKQAGISTDIFQSKQPEKEHWFCDQCNKTKRNGRKKTKNRIEHVKKR